MDTKAKDTKMRNFLVVDDHIHENNTFGEFLTKKFKKRNIKITFLSSAEKALELLLNAPDFDVILLDGNFDHTSMQGPEAVIEIKKITQIPIVMISDTLKLRAKGIENGASGYLDKNDIIDETKKCIDYLLLLVGVKQL